MRRYESQLEFKMICHWMGALMGFRIGTGTEIMYLHLKLNMQLKRISLA